MTFIEGVVVSAIIVVLFLGIVLPFTGLHYEISNGEHTGYITAVEQNGIIFKTYSLYIKTKLDSSQEDRYCVDGDEQFIEELKEKSRNEEQVTLEFVDYFARGIYLCKTNDIAVVNSIK